MERSWTSASGFPQAPSQAEWNALSTQERQEVVDGLPNEVTDAEMAPSEGMAHSGAKVDAASTLRGFYKRAGRKVFVAMELPVYYPAKPRFAPDVLVVMDVEPHAREKWLVSAEGRGLDWVLEVHVGGDRKKDAEANVARYAALGIPEYFMYDRRRDRLLGYRLPPGATAYKPLLGQAGRIHSQVLGLDVMLDQDGLRFCFSNALLLTDVEEVDRLQAMVNLMSQKADVELAQAKEEAQQARAEAARTRAEAARSRAEAERAHALDEEVARLRVELELLRKGPKT